MKIAFATSSLHPGSNTRGIGTYTRELSKALLKKYPKDDYLVSLPDPNKSSVSLIHYPFFDLFRHTLPLFNSKPTVVTVHDVIPLKYPAHFPVGIRGKIAHFFQKMALKRVTHIITDSEASKVDITRHLGIPSAKITVIPLAGSPSRVNFRQKSKIKKDYSLPETFLLYVGDINWNKNLPSLITALADLPPHIHLVCVGKVFRDKPDIPEYHRVMSVISEYDLSKRVHLLGYVPSHHLPLIYRLATLYVQPSWDEGFGLPLLEAMQTLTPVLSSCWGSLPEVGGDAVAYFDPKLKGDLSAKIKALLSNPKKLAELSEQGSARAAEFSWTKVADATHAVYAKILN